MNRIQIFDPPHKALRLAFGELLTLAGKADFSNPSEVAALQKLMHEVFSLVWSHSHSEDDVVFAELDKFIAQASQHDRAEHIRLHKELDELEAKVQGILEKVKAGQSEHIAGRALYTDLCNLHTEMLIHMMEEELDTQPIIWQYFSDDEIRDFEHRILSTMSPEKSHLWMRYILPSATHADRVGMLSGIKANAPDFVFNGKMELAKEVLSGAEFEALEEALELMVQNT